MCEYGEMCAESLEDNERNEGEFVRHLFMSPDWRAVDDFIGTHQAAIIDTAQSSYRMISDYANLDIGRFMEMSANFGKETLRNIEKARFNDRKHIEAICLDGLTGLNNRKGFEFEMTRMLRYVIGGARKPSESSVEMYDAAAIVYFDLDNLKPVNDNYGHFAGDQLLKEVADRLHATFQTTPAICARLGGDEFVVFMPYAKKMFNGGYTEAQQIKELEEFADGLFEDEFTVPGFRGVPEKISLSASRGVMMVRPRQLQEIALEAYTFNHMYKESSILYDNAHYVLPPFSPTLLDLIDGADRKMYYNKKREKVGRGEETACSPKTLLVREAIQIVPSSDDQVDPAS